MAKNSVRDFSATAASNTDIQSVNIDESCPASGINNAIRELMADIKDVSTGTIALETPSADQLNVDNIRIDGNTISSTDTNGDITLDPDGTGDVVVASGHKLGIGTAAPALPLEVNGSTNVAVFRSDASNSIIQLANSTGTGGDNGTVIGSVGDDLYLRAGDAERMRIDSSGKVYIGRTSDPYMSTGSVKRLSVDGGTTSTDATFVSNKDSASTMYHFYFHNSNSVVGSISTNSYATSFNTSSDYRLKDNVSEMTGAIDRVKALAPKRFNWIDDADTTVDGFLAHEAQAVVPEAVTGTHNETQAATGIVKDSTGKVLAKDVQEADWSANEDGLYPAGSTWTASEDLPVYQTIDQSKLVPLLTGALQEAIAKIETLETEMTALKARVTALEA